VPTVRVPLLVSPSSPAEPSRPSALRPYTTRPDPQLCHPLTRTSQDVSWPFPPLDNETFFPRFLFLPLLLETISVWATPAEMVPRGGHTSACSVRVAAPTPPPDVLLSCLRLSASLDIKTRGRFPSKSIWWRYSVHLLRMLCFSRNKLQYLCIAMCNFNYDLFHTVPVSTRQIYTVSHLIFRPCIATLTSFSLISQGKPSLKRY